LRIAHVCPYDYSVAGGVCEHVRHLDKQMRSMGHDVTVIAPTSGNAQRAPNLVSISRWAAPVPGSGSIARISLSPLVYPRMKRILSTCNFDVVHLHEPLMPMVCLSSIMTGGPVMVGTIHGYRDKFIIYQVLRPLLRRLMDRLSARIAVSTDARQWAAQYFPGEYRIISDGVDVSEFGDPYARPMPHLSGGKANILFVGRLEPRKGFRYLLSAFRVIKGVVPDARLLVAGHYSEAQAAPYVDYAQRHNLSNVDFLGPVSAEDLVRYQKSAQVFCAPSTGFEALGIVLLEAMAAGTPIVTTNIEGYRTVVTDGKDALVVPPKDTMALARAITRLLEDADLRARLAGAALQTVERYAWPRLTQRIVAVYEECLAEARPTRATPRKQDC
jgi:phosphatidylinositol alpha-mannosyltransferase